MSDMTSRIDMGDIIATMKDAVGESSDVGLNERVSRLNLLLNKNRAIVTDEAASYKLRYRQAMPIQIGISAVTVFQNHADERGAREIVMPKQLLVREIIEEMWVRFRKYYDQSSVALVNYFPRLVSTGFLEKTSKLEYRLGEDFDSKIVNLLAPTQKVSYWNTYIKAMAQTVGCAVVTEKEPWEHTSSEVAERVNVKLIDKGILSWLYPPDKTAAIHIYPLHKKQDVDFYADNSEGNLGIPAVHSKLEREIYRYQDPYVNEKTMDLIEDELRLLQLLPVVSFPALAENWPITKKYIERHWNEPNFPFAVVPSTAYGPRVVLPKGRIKLLNELGGYSYAKCNLEQDLGLWIALPVLVGYSISHAPSSTPEGIMEGLATLKNCLRMLLDEAPVKPTQASKVERYLLGVMVDHGLAKDNESGEFLVKNREQLRLLQNYLTLWRK
jgi:hypothetical protein